MICDCPENETYNFDYEECVFGNGIVAYVPNLVGGEFWIYGKNGMEIYDESLSKINSMITTEECPFDTPYPDESGKCVTCG